MNDVSVVVPVFHGKNYIKGIISRLEECQIRLRKVQENASIELILVNDAPDEQLYNEKSSLIHVSVHNTGINRGIHGARVYGLSKSRGQFVLFLDQDDVVYPDYMCSQLLHMGEADAVVCRCIHEDKQFYNEDFKFEEVLTREYMLTKGNPVVSPGQVLLRRSSISEVWQENIMTSNCSDDYLLWLCMLSENRSFALNQDLLFEHTVTGKNLSLDYRRMIQSEKEMYTILERNRVFDKDGLKMISDMLEQAVLDRIALLEKFRRMFMTLNRIHICRESGNPIGSCLRQSGINKVAVYGDGYLGKRLMGELEEQNVKVVFFIDRNADYLTEKVPVYKMENAPKGIDAVIISMVQKFETVKTALEEKYHFTVYTMDEVIRKALEKK